jgi:hypothetical protein
LEERAFNKIQISVSSKHVQKVEEQRSFDQSSLPLDLHRLAALSSNNWNLSLMDQDLHAIHQCHNKKCFNPKHLYFGSNDQNRSTEFCSVWIMVNGVPIICCHHEPSCLMPGSRSYYFLD